MSRFEELEQEFNKEPEAKFKTASGYLFAFCNFLVNKIIKLEARVSQLENPSDDVEINVKKGGEKDGKQEEE